jgi:5-methylcytosine-specific restriction protein A
MNRMAEPIPVLRPFGWSSAQKSQRAYNRYARDQKLLALYSGMPWKRFRAMIRNERVLCEQCKAEGRVTVGTTVHHQVDPRIDPDRMLDETNVVLLCRGCHNAIHAQDRRRRNGRL